MALGRTARGALTVRIIGDDKDLRRAFKESEKGAQTFGTRMDRGFAGVSRWAKRGAVAIAAVGAAVTAIAIKGGIDRALKIEDAEAKLRGLGHSTEAIERIMKSALDSVLGTAFGLDEAATAAANAVAAGIPPGEELTRVLQLTGDAATIMGRDFNEAGAIVNKVLASNRVTMREVNQVQQAGLPILQMLADEYGVTALEMRNMVSQGVVDSKTFLNALESNIGGAALSAGDTTRGAFANMRAAMSRFGETLIKDVFPLAKEVFIEIGKGFDRMGEIVGPVLKLIGESDAFQRLRDSIGGIPELLADTARAIVGIMTDLMFWTGQITRAEKALLDFTAAEGRMVETSEDVVRILNDLNFAGTLLGGVLSDTALDFMAARTTSEEWADSLQSVFADLPTETLIHLKATFADWSEELDVSKPKLEALEEALDDAIRTSGQAVNAWESQRGPLGDLAASVDDVTESLEDQEDQLLSVAATLREQSDPVFGMIRAQERYEEATRNTTKAIADHGIESKEARSAAMLEADAYLAVRAAQERLADGFDGTRDEMRLMLAQMGMTPAMADLVIAELERIEGFKFSDKRFKVTATAPTFEFRQQAHRVLPVGTGSRVIGLQRGGIVEEGLLDGNRSRRQEAVIPLESQQAIEILGEVIKKAMGGARNQNITVHAATSADPGEIAREIAWRLRASGI